MLDLQRRVGNAAVSRVIGRSGTLARQPYEVDSVYALEGEPLEAGGAEDPGYVEYAEPPAPAEGPGAEGPGPRLAEALARRESAEGRAGDSQRYADFVSVYEAAGLGADDAPGESEEDGSLGTAYSVTEAGDGGERGGLGTAYSITEAGDGEDSGASSYETKLPDDDAASGRPGPVHPLAGGVPGDPYRDPRSRRYHLAAKKGHEKESETSFKFVRNLIGTTSLLNEAAKHAESIGDPRLAGYIQQRQQILDEARLRAAEVKAGGGDIKTEVIEPKIQRLNALAADLVRERDLAAVLLRMLWGWSDDDVERFYANRDTSSPKTVPWKVHYFGADEESRARLTREHAVIPSGNGWMIGQPPRPFDTSRMVSKFSGPGFAIFVMDPEGRIYAGQHRVGLFHHSSFVGGGQVAAAGELKVEGGRLVALTAKSGHYEPTPLHTRQFVKRLREAGVDLAGVKLLSWEPKSETDTRIVVMEYDAEEFGRAGAVGRPRPDLR